MPHAALTPPGVHPDRIRVLRDGAPRASGPVIYWMQASQRSVENPALAHAAAIARLLQRPLGVVFSLMPDDPEATARATAFMLEGLGQLRDHLAAAGIGFSVALGNPAEVALSASRSAAVLVVDRGYLRHQRAWRVSVAESADLPVVQVEGEVVVPVDVASEKAEYMARTLRPKLHRQFEHYLDPSPTPELEQRWSGPRPSVAPHVDVTEMLSAPSKLLRLLGVDDQVAPVSRMFPGGEVAAAVRVERLLGAVLAGYASGRNQPQRDDVSYLGMYLHFGMLSPVALLRAVRAAAPLGAPSELVQGSEGFVEELMVRRELAVNHVERTPHYGSYSSLPNWAQATLAKHAGDPRDHLYDDEALVAAASHDPYWNAAMVEMRETGYQHNYMRMYWGKKVLEWSASPEQAYERLLRWNNRYFLDGRDPNSYAGVGWVFGLHDRPWTERAIFGSVRYMNAAGLRRKADPEGYVRKVEARVASLAGIVP